MKLLLLKESVTIKDKDGNIQDRPTYTAQIDASDAEKGIYDHYMLKEINEQPAVMRRIIQEYEDENGDLNIDSEIIKDVSNADRIYIIAAGTSYHAGLVGKEYLENYLECQLKFMASEFVYNMPLLSENLYLFISLNQEKQLIAVQYWLKQIN